MRLTFDEVAGLLSKWKTECSSMSVIFMTEAAVLVARGWLMTELQTGSFVLSDPTGSGQLVVHLQPAFHFEYGDTREAPEEIRAHLSEEVASMFVATLGETAVLCLYELREEERTDEEPN